jgi:predicted metalloprotease with PDZ domain
MRQIALVFLLGSCSLAATGKSPVILKYSFQPIRSEDKLSFHVDLRFRGGPTGLTAIEVPAAWGGETHLETSFTNLKALSPGATIQDARFPNKIIHFRPNTDVLLSYDLIKDWTVPPIRPDHRVVLEPGYFEFNTQNALIHPELESSTLVEVHFDWRKLPAQWSLVTSFGANNRLETFRGSWGDVNNAMFGGGDFRIHRAMIVGRPLIVAITGEWKFTDEEAVAQITKIVAFERAMWRDNNFPYYLVTLAPFLRPGGSSGGSAFTQAFAMYLQKDSSFSYGAQSLLAHETFHTWNPYRFGPLPNEGSVLAWFTEGFTTYYQDLLLLRAGLLTLPEYIRYTNERLRSYFFSSAKNLSNSEMAARHRTDAAAGQMPYIRGSIIALWLDAKIREAGARASTLDTLMFDLAAQARSKTPPRLGDERILGAAKKYLDDSSIRQFREFAELGSTIPIPETALGPCVSSRMESMPAFELGFSRDALERERIIRSVLPDSEAFRAGLREGQQVSRMNIWWNDISKPVKLTVKTADGARAIEYYPRGRSLEVPQYRLNAAEFEKNPAGCLLR